jgi:photosystem II stability/assembly factor-like uncharacterized protein
MKKTLILINLVFLFGLIVCAQSAWNTLASGTTQPLSSVFFIRGTGFAIGGNGQTNGNVILKTIDGGANWRLYTIENKFYSIYFIDKNTGYAVDYYGILKTIDGAVTWSRVFSSKSTTEYNPIDYRYNAIFFTNSTTGYCVGGFYSEESPIMLPQGTILKTTDGGTTWSEQSNGVTLGLLSVYFVDENDGYAVGERGEIYKTINGGIDWTSTNIGFTWEPEVSHLNSIFFIGDIGYIVGSGGKIYKTKNGGVDWIEQVSGTTINLNSVYFTDIDTGYIVGGIYGISGALNAIILKTSDGGVTWEAQASGTNYPLSSVCFTDINTGYAVGSNGTIIKTTTGGINSIADITADINILFPNPVKDVLTLELKSQVPANQIILISIYNLKGDLVMNENACYTDKISINVSQLAVSTYILVIVDKENVKYEGRFIKE